MAEIKRVTLHPLKPSGEIDTDVNLYPKTLVDGIVDREGNEVEVVTTNTEQIITGEKRFSNDVRISNLLINTHRDEEGSYATLEWDISSEATSEISPYEIKINGGNQTFNSTGVYNVDGGLKFGEGYIYLQNSNNEFYFPSHSGILATTSDIKTYKTFPESWAADESTADFCRIVNADPEATKGNVFLGEVYFSDMPFNGNGDAIVEIIDGTGTSGKVIHIILTSGNIEPYRWEYTYWNNGLATSGWQGYQLELPLNKSIGPNSFVQKADTSGDSGHRRGGTALGESAVALGYGDCYTITTSTYSGVGTEIICDNANPNWQNMVLRLNGNSNYNYDTQYRRIVLINDDAIIIDSAFDIGTADAVMNFDVLTGVAKGEGSYVEGTYNRALGDGAHAEGTGNAAVGNCAHAEGWMTIANQHSSHSSGRGTIAAGIGQTAVGNYNEIDFNAEFIVGNGEDNLHRSTAFKVNTNGTATVQTDPVNNKDVATKQYVDNNIPDVSTKRDLTESRKVVYATSGTETESGSGKYTQTEISYSSGLNSNCLVQRDADKQIMVPAAPTQDNHAASKKYVDDAVSGITSGHLYKHLIYASNLGFSFDIINNQSTPISFNTAGKLISVINSSVAARIHLINDGEVCDIVGNYSSSISTYVITYISSAGIKHWTVDNNELSADNVSLYM